MNWSDRLAHKVAPFIILAALVLVTAAFLLPGAVAILADNAHPKSTITAGTKP